MSCGASGVEQTTDLLNIEDQSKVSGVGFIVLEVPDEATALEVAAGWPALLRRDCAVEVRPVGDSTAEAGMR